MVAAVIGFTIPYPLFATRHLPDRRAARWAARGALVILLWALLLTFSRGAWISVGVAALIGTLLLDWRSLPYLIVGVVLAWGAATVMPRDLLVPEAAAGSVLNALWVHREMSEPGAGRGFGSRIASDSFVYGLGGIANQAVAILLVPIYARVLGDAGSGSRAS